MSDARSRAEKNEVSGERECECWQGGGTCRPHRGERSGEALALAHLALALAPALAVALAVAVALALAPLTGARRWHWQQRTLDALYGRGEQS